MVKLRKDTLETWVSKYNLQNVNYKVAIIMAGNFPLARDHMGIIPLYIGWDSKGVFYVSS